jgi:non-heme chloroperoxidase
MSATKRLVKAAGLTAGVVAGVAGAAYGAEQAVIRSLRHRPDPDAGRLGPLIFDEEHRFESHDGGSLYVVSRGRGPAIVLSHGVTIDSRVWVKQFRMLPDLGLRVVAFDHRGHGHSLVGSSGHSIDNLGADVRTVLERLDLRDALLVGHSMGGLAVQSFVLGHAGVARSRVRGIVLLSTFARTPLSAVSSRGSSTRVNGWLDLAGLMRRPQLGTLLARVGFGREPLASHVELTRQMLAECAADTARDAIVPLLGVDLTSQLHRIDLPTLVVGGKADLLTPPAEARRLAAHIPGAHLVLFERAGHMLMLERSEELDALLVDFARDVGVLPTAEAASA